MLHTEDFTCATTLVPGGVIGVARKLNCPNKYEYDDSFGLLLTVRSNISDLFVCFTRRHHSVIKNAGSIVANLALKYIF